MFEKAKIIVPHPDRFRHTFAVELLKQGTPAGMVAGLLRNTEQIVAKHYSAWIEARQQGLDEALRKANGYHDILPIKRMEFSGVARQRLAANSSLLAKELERSPGHIRDDVRVAVQRPYIARLHQSVDANDLESAFMLTAGDVLAILRRYGVSPIHGKPPAHDADWGFDHEFAPATNWCQERAISNQCRSTRLGAIFNDLLGGVSLMMSRAFAHVR